jgi:hypothetical protein
VEHWQWVALLLAALGAWVVGRAAGRVTTRIMRRVFGHTTITWDDEIAVRLAAPLTLGWGVGFFWVGVARIDLPERIEHLVTRGLRAVLVAGAFWGMMRVIWRGAPGRSRIAGPSRCSRSGAASPRRWSSRWAS